MDIKTLAHEVQPQVVAFRRDIHQNPETGLQEFRTTQKVCEELDKLGISYRKTDPTGVIAEIVGTRGPSDHRVLIGPIWTPSPLMRRPVSPMPAPTA